MLTITELELIEAIVKVITSSPDVAHASKVEIAEKLHDVKEDKKASGSPQKTRERLKRKLEKLSG